MKIRTCFVSNSSSSSFIISKENKEKAIQNGMELYSIQEMISKLEDIRKLHIELNEKISAFGLPEDIEDESYDLYALTNLIKELNKIDTEYPGSSISSHVNNDIIYDEDIELPYFRSQ